MQLFRLVRHTLYRRSNRPTHVTNFNHYPYTNDFTVHRHTRFQLFLRRNSISNKNVSRVNTNVRNINLLAIGHKVHGGNNVSLDTNLNRNIRTPHTKSLPNVNNDQHSNKFNHDVRHLHLFNIPYFINSTNSNVNVNVIRHHVHHSVGVAKLRSSHSNESNVKKRFLRVRQVNRRLRTVIFNRNLIRFLSHNNFLLIRQWRQLYKYVLVFKSGTKRHKKVGLPIDNNRQRHRNRIRHQDLHNIRPIEEANRRTKRRN